MELNPDRKIELQKASGMAIFINDQDKGETRDNPTTVILLDSLQYGAGNWERSIAYLNDKVSNTDRDTDKQNYLNVLAHVKGLYAADQAYSLQREREMIKKQKTLADSQFKEIFRKSK